MEILITSVFHFIYPPRESLRTERECKHWIYIMQVLELDFFIRVRFMSELELHECEKESLVNTGN